jgi:hypothetical protein
MTADFLDRMAKAWLETTDKRIVAAALVSHIRGKKFDAYAISQAGIMSYNTAMNHREEIELKHDIESFQSTLSLKQQKKDVSIENNSCKKTNEDFQSKLSMKAEIETPNGKPEKKKKCKESDEAVAFRRSLFKIYSEERARRWNGAMVSDNQKLRTQIKNFSSAVPKDCAAEVIRYYCAHHDAWYVKSMHDFGLLLRDAQKIYGEWQTGIIITNSKAKKAELISANDRAAEEYLRSKREKEKANAVG